MHIRQLYSSYIPCTNSNNNQPDQRNRNLFFQSDYQGIFRFTFQRKTALFVYFQNTCKPCILSCKWNRAQHGQKISRGCPVNPYWASQKGIQLSPHTKTGRRQHDSSNAGRSTKSPIWNSLPWPRHTQTIATGVKLPFSCNTVNS